MFLQESKMEKKMFHQHLQFRQPWVKQPWCLQCAVTIITTIINKNHVEMDSSCPRRSLDTRKQLFTERVVEEAAQGSDAVTIPGSLQKMCGYGLWVHGLMLKMVMRVGGQLDLMILKLFPTSTILWFYATRWIRYWMVLKRTWLVSSSRQLEFLYFSS